MENKAPLTNKLSQKKGFKGKLPKLVGHLLNKNNNNIHTHNIYRERNSVWIDVKKGHSYLTLL